MKYWSNQDIIGMGISFDEVVEAILGMINSKERGEYISHPKTTLEIAPGHFFQSLMGASISQNLAGVKWVSVAHNGPISGISNVHARILLNNLETGVPLAVLDANWITTIRTAALSIITARYLARPISRRIGLIGAGVQALSHLNAFVHCFDSLEEVSVFTRTRASAGKVLEAASKAKLRVEISAWPEQVVQDSDIIVTTVPASHTLEPFLNGAWLKDGAFVSAVDLGRSWYNLTKDTLDIVCTDDIEQAHSEASKGKLNYRGTFDAELLDLVSGRKHGRTDEIQKSMFIFPGFALADLAVAALVCGYGKEGTGLQN